MIEEDDFFPADLILMSSSNENASCLIKTSSLDGESAPKIKKVAKGLDWVIPSGSANFSPDELICTGKATVEAPTSNLYQFEGRMVMSKKTYALNYEQMLLKGTQLTNTEWVLGFVAYTGKETRIMMNSQAGGQIKQSDVERLMNKFTVFIVIGILVLTITLALLGGFWHAEASEIKQELENLTQTHFYIEFSYDSIAEAFFTVARYF